MGSSEAPDAALTERPEAIALLSGASLVGFADVQAVAPLPRAVAIAIRHSPEVFGIAEEMPTCSYYQEYLDLNRRLDEIAAVAAEALQKSGHTARISPATLAEIAPDTLAAPFPHKTAATRGGLGWIGTSALLVNPRFGPALRLVTVLTDAPLLTGAPVQTSECGECTACKEACPGDAISGEEWHPGRPREEFYDAFACGQAVLARAQAIGITETVCGICMMACPGRPER